MVNQKNSDIFLQRKVYLGDLLSKGRPKGDHFGQKSPGDLFGNTAYTKEVLHVHIRAYTFLSG